MKAKSPRGFSRGEEQLLQQLLLRGFAPPVRQYRFSKERRWRFDFAWPAKLLAVEIEGVTLWGQSLGWHQRPQRFESDCVKYNTAQLDGWRVLRFTPAMVKDGRAMLCLEYVVPRA